MNQTDMVWNHIQKHGSITPKEAYELYSCLRLGARIWDLRNIFGKDIYTRIETKPNRFGVPTTYARYWIKDDGDVKEDGKTLHKSV